MSCVHLTSFPALFSSTWSRPCVHLLPAVAAPALVLGCSPAPAPGPAPPPDLAALFMTAAPPPTAAPAASTAATELAAPAPEPDAACATDGDCGYDPTRGRCGADPRYNKQPPLVDQGLVCYCDSTSRTCALLRVEPAPCEGDTSCAVRMDPRPHPVHTDAAHPYRKPPRCIPPRRGAPRRAERFVTCERTNICTMHTRECASP